MQIKIKITSILLLLAVTTFTFFAFTPKEDIYNLDLSKSSITWVAKKVGGGHNGTVSLTSGTLGFNGKQLTQGGFVANMKSIKDVDNDASLEKHLKADDFFGAEKYPEANFVITKVAGNGSSVKITGDLTIKGIKNSITFPAKIVWNSDKSVTATADKITVDRTKFNVKYKSKSFFPELADNFIYDEFKLAVKLVATK